MANGGKMEQNTGAAHVAASKPKAARRHLWELPANAHCPLIGLCLPLPLLRRLVDKGLGGKALATDYALHVGAVSECKSRNRVAVLLEDALDQRYCVMLHTFRAAHSGAEVERLWQAARGGDDMAGAFWAALTHPASDHQLQESLLCEVHMLHHHACAAPRTSASRLARVEQALAQAQAAHDRQAQQLIDKTRALAQARATLLERDGAIEQLQRAIAALSAATPDLDERLRLKDKLAQADSREQALRQQLAEARRQLVEARRLAVASAVVDAMVEPADAAAAVEEAALASVRLDDKTVLCVGGRHRSVASYRGMTEQTGAQFVHHDGGVEDSAALLDASLAAADLVICQTGCISHSAYWRVKHHCKRTGKQCVFVDNPSASSFNLGLQRIVVQGETA